jgi:predicted exporter
VFGQIYLLTLVFGAALLGEAVDYSIQYLSARANAGHMAAAPACAKCALHCCWRWVRRCLGYALLGLVPFPRCARWRASR